MTDPSDARVSELRQTLETALALADEVGETIVAIRIAEAIDLLDRRGAEA